MGSLWDFQSPSYRFQLIDMRVENVGLDLHTEAVKSVTHLLEYRKFQRCDPEPITKKTLDVTLAAHFVVTAAIAMRQANPVQRIIFSEKSIVLGREEAGDSAQRPALHPLDSPIELSFDSAVENAAVFECHVQIAVAQELL